MIETMAGLAAKECITAIGKTVDGRVKLSDGPDEALYVVTQDEFNAITALGYACRASKDMAGVTIITATKGASEPTPVTPASSCKMNWLRMHNAINNGSREMIHKAAEAGLGVPELSVALPHAEASVEPVTDGRFYLWIWSSPLCSGGRSWSHPRMIFGKKDICKDGLSLPCPSEDDDQYTIIRDGSNIIGCMTRDGKNMYTFFDAVEYSGTSDEPYVMLEFFKAARRLRENPPVIPDPAEKNKRNYLKLCMSNRKSILVNTEAELKRATKSLDDYKQQINTISRQCMELHERLEALKSGGKKESEFELEYQKLLANPKIKKIEATPDALKIHTNEIICTMTCGRKFRLGTYIITLHTNGRSFYHRNEGMMMGGYHAPHVFSDGHACYGNMEGVIPDLIGQGDWTSAIMMAIRFLESVNEKDSIGKNVTAWPEITTEEDQDKPKAVAAKPRRKRKAVGAALSSHVVSVIRGPGTEPDEEDEDEEEIEDEDRGDDDE